MTAREALEVFNTWYNKAFYPDELKCLETALKEKERQDFIIKTSKEVIKSEQMLPHIEPNKDNGFDLMSAVHINIQRDIENRERELLRKWVIETCFPKELKALEIIKEKRVDVGILWHYDFNYYDYNFIVAENRRKLTEEDINLLWEVLK